MPDVCGDVVATRAGAAVSVLVSSAGQGDAQAVVAQVARVGVWLPGEVQMGGRHKSRIFVLFAANGVNRRPRDVGFCCGQAVPVMYAVGVKADVGAGQVGAVALRQAMAAPSRVRDEGDDQVGGKGAVVIG